MMANFVGVVASSALIALATTGDPVPLQKELGGEVVASHAIPAAAVLSEGERLAPSALKLENGTIIAMIAPTTTKDNFVVYEGDIVLRLDAGYTEGTNVPFVVGDSRDVENGDISVWKKIGNWFQNSYSRWFD